MSVFEIVGRYITPDGEVFEIRKSPRNGSDIFTVYRSTDLNVFSSTLIESKVKNDVLKRLGGWKPGLKPLSNKEFEDRKKWVNNPNQDPRNAALRLLESKISGTSILVIEYLSIPFGPVRIYRWVSRDFTIYTATWAPAFSAVEPLAGPTYNLEDLLEEIKARGHKLWEKKDLGGYPLYAAMINGQMIAVSVEKTGKFQLEINAANITHLVLLEKGALNFFVFWRGENFVSFLESLQKPPPVDETVIIRTVCKYFNMRRVDLESRSRSVPIVTPRQITMFLLREDGQLSLKRIGLLLGNRDHSTVIHAVNKISGLLAQDKKIAEIISDLRSEIADSTNLLKNGLA